MVGSSLNFKIVFSILGCIAFDTSGNPVSTVFSNPAFFFILSYKICVAWFIALSKAVSPSKISPHLSCNSLSSIELYR